MIKKIGLFTKEVVKRIYKNDLYTQANAMTFRMILAIFPFFIVVIASLSLIHLDINEYITSFLNTLNYEVRELVENVLNDVFNTKHISIISFSAIIALFSASSGFAAMINGMNIIFGKSQNRGLLFTRILSVVLVIAFILIVTVTLLLLIFGDLIKNLIISFNIIPSHSIILSSIGSYLFLGIGIFIGCIFLIVVYKSAIDKKLPIKNIMPGILFTIGVWLIASKIFNFYVNNFYKYSILYGSIGTFFVFALWMNILCYVILIGAQINAVLSDKNFMKQINCIK